MGGCEQLLEDRPFDLSDACAVRSPSIVLAPHQREAAEQALALLATRGGVLLADDVGLGKSFVAAEVMRRFDGPCELIVPLSLVPQWRELVPEQTRIFTHDSIEEPDPPRRRLVVVDEAHAFRNPRTRRYAALARRTAGARVLLVTATPVCNTLGDLHALVRLIARDDLLADLGVPSIDIAFESGEVERIVSALVIRRERDVLPEWLPLGELERRVIRHPVPELPIGELQFPLVTDADLLRRFLRRRLESSEAAFVESVRRQLRFYQRALGAVAAGRTLPKREYRRAFAYEEDQAAFQEVLFWELFAPPGEVDPQLIRDEMARLQSLMEQARALPNAKRTLLRVGAEPTLIFTGSLATARDLAKHLGCALVTSKDRGGLQAFLSGRADVLVSTDVAAEGLNLQRAGAVVHYDIPWNPVKLDQRNGRAYRIGQTRGSVKATYFIPENRGVIETVARKNRIRRHALKRRTAQATSNQQQTLRPRVTAEAPCLRFSDLPPRRYKAGIELLMDEVPLPELLELIALDA
jgi:superfamily II DNA or RNA helicase